MNRRGIASKVAPQITIRVSGKLFEGHLPYLEQMVQSAAECKLWPLLDFARLEELDHAAVSYLIDGEDRDFSIASCPSAIRACIDREKKGAAA